MKKIFALSILALSSLASYGQTFLETDDWSSEQRPEQLVTETIESDGTHRVKLNVGSHSSAPLMSKGVQNVPVVLVNFADRKFTLGNVERKTPEEVSDSVIAEFYDKFCNGSMDGTVYKGHESYGAIRDYFVAMSDSIFQPKFTIIGPVTLNKGYASYGYNSGSSKDLGFSAFCREALQKSVDLGTDWTIFDNDKNGTIDMVFFIYAGWGESNTAKLDPDAIWAKESAGGSTIGEHKFGAMGACQELRVNTSKPVYNLPEGDPDRKLLGFGTLQEDSTILGGERPDGIGVFVHELSHALGLPDFYDTTGKAFGMDLWSIMDYGEYGEQGFTPGGYNAYERDFMQWQPLVEINEPQILTLQCFADGGCGYKVVNESNPNEYYVLENRQAKGWDSKVCTLGHGLQVTHVDYNYNAWVGNRVNTDSDHQRMTIIPANGLLNGVGYSTTTDWKNGLAGNLYPGNTFNYNLTDETTPASVVFTGDYMHKPIRNITENEDGTITLCFRTNGQLDVPEATDASNTDDNTTAIEWNAVEYATRYAIELYREDNDIEPQQYLALQDTTTELSYTFADIDHNRTYQCRVKALADSPEDYIESEWSDYVGLTLTTEIATIPEGECLVDIYHINGTYIGRYQADQTHRLRLGNGIYIMRDQTGHTRKFMVR